MYRYMSYKYITYIDILPPLLKWSLSLVWSWGAETPKKLPTTRVISYQLHQLPGQLQGHPIENRLKLLVIQEEVQHIPHSSVNTSREI